MIIRDPSREDEAAWKRLWSGYNAYYETRIDDAVTEGTWRRILDPSSAIFARLAVHHDDVVGFSVSVLHDGTWTSDPVCYLEDLFVDANWRGRGAGRLLIQDLIYRARVRRWSRVYWHTRADNPARRLYDEFAQADGWVRYRLLLE
jgi:GNAT superfamily N-acetyltransferase